MRRFYWSVAISLILTTAIMMIYLLNVNLDVPAIEKNTVVDPATYMTAEQLQKSEQYSRLRYIIYFLNLPFEWALYLAILGFGISHYYRKVAEGVTRLSIIHVFFYLFLLLLTTTIILLPFDLLRFNLGHHFGVTTQSLGSWIGDVIKGYWIDLFLTIPVVWFLFWLIKKSPKRWWVYAWLLTIPFLISLTLLQPVVLDPLFNDFYPLQNEDLKEKILALAHEADVPAHQVFEVDMSSKTNALNAYVTGIGPSARIVLWDTTLQKMEEDEILFIMAHEIGHYVKKHIYWSMLGGILISFLFLWFLAKVLESLVTHFGHYWKIRGMDDMALYPLILLLASVLLFFASPVSNMISRSAEHSADVYALRLTNDTEAAVSTFQKLSTEGLSYPNPPKIVRLFLSTHPTIVERIRFAHEYGNIRQEVQK